MSNGVFKFDFLVLLLSEILGGLKFTLGGHTPPGRPLAEKFLYPKRDFTISNCVFNFNILTLVVSEILGGSQIYVRGPVPPSTLSSGFFCTPASTLVFLMAFLISTF